MLLGTALLLAAAPAGAAEMKALAALTEIKAWATPLDDKEMGELRGGFAGFAFNVIMSGTIDRLASSSSGPVTTGVNDPTVTVQDGMVNIQTAIGSFNGASGVFQLANLEHSSFNVVNQNLFVQIALIDVANTADIPTIQNLLSGAFGH
ncbi:MAG: hypothetical protein ACOY3L_09745 [Pseudomonadota bacterium]